MRVTQSRLKQIIQEELGSLESDPGGTGPGIAASTRSDKLGVAIEDALALAQEAGEQEVMDLLSQAHEELMGI